MQRSTFQIFPRVLETPLQFIFVTFLLNKCYFYHLWLLVITKTVKKQKSNKFNRLQIDVSFLENISPPPPPPNIVQSSSSFVRIYAQSVLTGFYSIMFIQYIFRKYMQQWLLYLIVEHKIHSFYELTLISFPI